MIWTLLGCATIGTFQAAETVGAGEGAFGVAASWWSQGDPSHNGAPHVDLTGRHGVTDGIDLGVSLGSSGLGVLTKLQLTSPDAPVVLSIAPALYVFPTTTPDPDDDDFAAGLSGQVPLLLGLPLGKHQLVLAPKVHGWSLGDRESRFSLGGSVGLVFRARRVSFVPEIAATTPVATGPDTPPGRVWVQGGFAFLVGP